ncbi:UbiD family decarboxylase [Streptomyces sp. SID8352]|uniref:UbiD family decarboxylase n=1 Tax=Streptomyces sp. SID8352 TaxID=2690338 RepID=UPI0013698D00|nr:UbiD family decarboxylase [Streptomyces sp. SID8352]MYU21134.1 UbiD family decarboxylase [Streptomyces sp. SID8352]
MNEPDLRTWLDVLEAAGQLAHVRSRVDWDEEIGAITRATLALGGPALLFENITDHTQGRCTRFLTGGLGNKHQVRLLLSLPEDTSDQAVVRHLKETFQRPVPPRVVDTGPVKENILRDDAINLWEFPVPKWHHTDGGRYIDTFCGVVTQDRVTQRDNIGIYRGQVLGERKIGKLLIPTQGWGGHFQQHREAAKSMPVAVVYGGHDALPFCAGTPFPKRICEWDMMGAVLGQPISLVPCETVPLHVPASAEIVVEGYIDPDPATYEDEGPFGEYPGYLGGQSSPKPVLRVTCVTHRDDPILRGSLEASRPGFPTEDGQLCAYAWSAVAWNMLEDAGVSGITDVWMSAVSTGASIIVQIHKMYRGHAQQVAAALWGTAASQWFWKNVIVVEEDIDIRDPVALDWAVAFRVNAGMGDITFYGPTFGSVLDPSTPPEKANAAKYGTGEWTRVLIDATRSWERERRPEYGNRRYPPLYKLDSALEDRIAKRWPEYGIGIPYLDDAQRASLTLTDLAKRLPEV